MHGSWPSDIWLTANKLKSPSNFMAGHSKAALLFWFFGGFNVVCGYALLILLDIKIENR